MCSHFVVQGTLKRFFFASPNTSLFPTHRASVCPKTIFRGPVTSMTRHGMPLPSHHGGTYLSIRILHAFEPLGWQELGQAMGAHSVTWIRSYNCRSSDLAVQRLLRFNLQRHHIPLYITRKRIKPGLCFTFLQLHKDHFLEVIIQAMLAQKKAN